MNRQKANTKPAGWESLTAPAGMAEQKKVWLDRNKPPESCPSLYSLTQSVPEYLLHCFTWDYMNGRGSPEPNTTWRDYAVEAAKKRATEAVRHLQSLALNGNGDGLAALAELTISSPHC